MSIDSIPPVPPQRPDPSPVAGAIRKAAQATGASFEYLLATAKVESNLKPGLAAKTSSATGLFQFIEQTWLGMIKQAGQALGFGRYAEAITRTSSGRYQVADQRLRNEILQLRKDAAANATMAGVFTQQNAAALGKRIGRVPSEGELYMAHFFGSGGASKLINAAGTNPHASAANLFPAAARANRSIFYDRQGQARSIAGVYAELNRRYQVARANVAPDAAPTAVAATAPPQATRPAPDTAGTTMAFAAARPVASSVAAMPASPAQAAASRRVQPGELAFRSLFMTADARGPVSPVVAELWGAPATRSGGDAGAPLDLFQDAPPDARAIFKGRA
ncbi:MAG: lytic transglycosylase domain-containing protein [Xanthobacteraceae bacterium]